jgi:hypothetical protein
MYNIERKTVNLSAFTLNNFVILNKGYARRGICSPEWEVVCGYMEDIKV